MNEATIDHETGNPIIDQRELDGVRRARVVAFFIDYLLIILVSVPLFFVLFLLSILTLGLAWGLAPFLLGGIALLYLAFTLGGPKQATVGMAFMGIKIKRLDGGRVDPLMAILHGLLFWVIHTVAAVIPLFATFFSSRKRLLHDLLLGTYVARA